MEQPCSNETSGMCLRWAHAYMDLAYMISDWYVCSRQCRHSLDIIPCACTFLKYTKGKFIYLRAKEQSYWSHDKALIENASSLSSQGCVCRHAVLETVILAPSCPQYQPPPPPPPPPHPPCTLHILILTRPSCGSSCWVNHFSVFLHHFVLVKLATSSIRVFISV